MSYPDNFGVYLGYRLIPPAKPELPPQCSMEITEAHLSGAGVAHGGAVFSLLDFAMGAAVFCHFKTPEERCSTVSLTIEYLKPIPLGSMLTVTVHYVHRGRSLVRMRADIHNQDNVRVAFGIGTFNLYRKEK